MASEVKGKAVPHPEQVARLRQYYAEVSERACHWSSAMPKAIDAWEREPQLLAEIERLRADADRLRLCCELLQHALRQCAKGEAGRFNWRAAVEMIDAALGEEGVP